MAGPWEQYTPPAEATPADGPWKDYAAPAEPASSAGADYVRAPSFLRNLPPIADAMRNFGHEFSETWGSEKIGVDPSSVSGKWLSKTFGPKGDSYDNPIQAADDLLFNTVAGAWDIAARGMSALFRGGQAAVATIFPRDIAAIPEAFFGSPHPTGIPKALPERPIRPGEVRPEPAAPREAGAETPQVGGEGGAIQKQISPGVFVDGNRTIIEGAPRADFIEAVSRGETDVPTVEEIRSAIRQTDEAEKKYGRALGLDDAKLKEIRRLDRLSDEGGATADEAIARKKEILKDIPDLPEPAIADLGSLKQLASEFEALEKQGHENLAEFEDGIARVLKRYIGAFTDGDDFARAVFRKAFVEAQAHGLDTKKLGNDVINRFLSELSGSDQQFMREEFARFLAPKIAAPEAVSGQPPLIDQARELGVIGPERPEATFNDSPSDLADKALPRDLSSASTPEEMRSPQLGHKPGAYDQRGKEWIDKIDAPEDVRDVIEKISNDKDFFPEARGGVASEASRASVAEAAGVNPADIDQGYFATHFDNDGKVRAVIQVLRQTAKDFADASDKLAKDPSVENAAALAEAQMRHTHALEYTMGLRAESGRSLNAWKDLLRQTEQSKAKVALKSGEQTGEVPTGVSDIVDVANEVQENLKEPGKKIGLQKLVDKAKELVDKVDEPTVPRTGPLSPEVAGLVGEARKVLKRFGAEKDAELENFRKSLEQLTAGEGKISDTVEAARALLDKNKKPEAEAKAQKTPSERGRLMGAAKRLVEATDKTEGAAAKPASAEMQALMEAARQAVGRIKNQNLAKELADFRSSLNSGDAARAAEAANRLIENDAKARASGQPKPPVEYDTIMAAARRVAAAAKEEAIKQKQALPPDIVSSLDEAKKAAGELKTARETELGKLIDAAEKQAVNMTKQKAVKEPLEALPPEFQALVDKTQRIVDRFGGIAKGERSAMLLARTGRTLAEQERLARSVHGLTPDQVANVLNKLRSSPEAERPGWFYWLWQQGLISGLVTHAKYLTVNTATVFAERVASPFVAAVIGRARGQNTSLAAPLYANVAMVHSLPDAFVAAGEAFRTGNRVPLASEMRLFERGEESPQTKGAAAAYGMPSPDFGIWERVFNEDQLDTAARVLGIPGRSANMIHTFYKVVSERASASTIAFEAAHEEGAKGDKFWQRYQYHLDNPSDDALRQSVNDAYSGAFMSKLGPKTTEWAHALSKNPIMKWAFPFQHIPWNIERMSIEYSPFKILGPEMRDALLGGKGEPAQNLAIAKMVVGSSVIGYFVHKALTGEATADYPTDQKERNRWKLLGIQPNSIQIGGRWVSLERLGPAGNVAHMGASIGSIVKNYDGKDDNALTSAIWAASVAAANQVGNEVGFQTLRNLFDALGNEKKADRFVAWQASSFLYPSSFLGQTASAIDPYQRKAEDLLSGLKYRIPLLRENLPPERDPLFGTPIPNPGYHSILRQGEVNADPVKMELDRLKYYPTKPEDRIGEVKLPPKLYDEYQARAGAMVQPALESLVTSPGWANMPPVVRQDVIKGMIESMRKTAQAVMQVRHPDILGQGVQDKKDKINGTKPGKLKD